ncbi:Predicted ATPase [Marivirga sericea]|uniref:Predicted ATPase n=2 Tax=Marivirga sericea TaxID=1028 RepID=A0A1X7LAT3_9BACT|nr:Predicted ATPase [Marivirga sericea]
MEGELIYNSTTTSIYKTKLSEYDSDVLVKLLKKEHESDKKINQFENELQISKKLENSGFRKALSKKIIDGQHALVLEYVAGTPLSQVFTQTVSISEFLDIAIQSSTLLGKLHQKHIIHKDINSNNILYDQTNKKISIIDFNISSEINLKSNHLENPDRLEGTLQYISPEQTGRVNRIIDYRSDLYSLGITLYEVLCRALPFRASDSLELIHFHIAKKPVAPHKQNDKIPKVISEIILKLLSKNAEDRYQSAEGLLHDLHKCQQEWEKTSKITDFTIGQEDFSNQFTIPEKLYGRSTEIQQLLDAFSRASNLSKELVLVSGASGTGKSALISEVNKPITEKKGEFLSGKFDQFQRNNPYFAISQAFKSFTQSILSKEENQLKIWRDKIQNTLGENGEVLLEIIPEMELVIGKQPPLPNLGAAESQNRLNFVFQKFIKSIAQAEHPLVIFIDDMQWADTASLNLLNAILADKEIENLLIILSYRDNEVAEAHPFQLMLDKLKLDELAITKIALENLSLDSIVELLKDALLDTGAQIMALAELIQQKTGGNAFFVTQFLRNLYEEAYITAKPGDRKWSFDLDKVSKMGFSDNVLDLMMQKAEKLPKDLQETLKTASVVGNTFSLQELTQLSNQKNEVIIPILKKALQENLIIPLRDNIALLSSTTIKEEIQFKFVHDRIQQAFYELLGHERAQLLHLSIGRMIKSNSEKDKESNILFEMINHFNQALNLINDVEEKIEISKLNSWACEKAILSAAYESALNYAENGMKLIEGEKLEDELDLLFQINLRRAEAEHLCDRDGAANEFYDKAIALANGKKQKADAYEKKIHFYTNIGDFKKAYATGSEVLNKIFNIKLPQNPPKPALIINMLKTKSKFKGQPIRDFVNHKRAEDENVILAVKLMAAILKSAYQIKPELAVANAMVMVNLCMKKGNTPESAIGYLVFGGIFMGGILGMRKTGQQFGQLARDLNEKYGNMTQRSEVLFVNGYFATSWLNPAIEAESYFNKAYETGLETGDLFHTGCSCCATLQHQLMRGIPLKEIEKKAGIYQELLKNLSNNQELIGTVKAVKQAVLCFQGKTARATSFDDEQFSEKEYSKQTEGYVSQHFAHYFFINKLYKQYLNRDFEETKKTIKKSKSLMDASAGMLHSSEHYFWAGMNNAIMHQKSGDKKSDLNTAIKRFKKWKIQNPANFEAKYLFLKAEGEFINKKYWHAAKTYTQAIESARKYHYLHLPAMIHERMAELMDIENRHEEAKYHLNRSIIMYSKQGFQNKAEVLQKKQSTVYGGNDITSSTLATTSAKITEFNFEGANTIDINTIIKSSQTLSGEVVLSKLLDKVMHLVIENAGAEKGFLMLKNEDTKEWFVEASCDVENTEVELMQHLPIKDMMPRGKNPQISAGIVNYVMRTEETIVLNDATKEGNFTQDEHVLLQNPKSVLCIPLVYKGKMLGILYLENNLSYGAFNADRTRILNMLTTQMAISIENAMLYENLEEKVQKRTVEVVEQKEIIEKKNENITASIKYAERIQSAALPTNESISASLKENFIYFKPRDIVSGDFYWFAKTKDKIFIAAVDCTGHGVPGAFMSLVGESHLTSIVKQNNILEPGKILDHLHDAIQRSLKQKESNNQDGMDAALCAIDITNNTLEYAGANNPLVMVDQKGEMTIIKANKMAIGGKRKTRNNDRFTNHKVDLVKGTTFYIYSDGYADQFGGPNDRKFMVKNMKKLLQDIAPEPVEKQKSILGDRFESWKGQQSQVDDVLVIGFRVI